MTVSAVATVARVVVPFVVATSALRHVEVAAVAPVYVVRFRFGNVVVRHKRQEPHVKKRAVAATLGARLVAVYKLGVAVYRRVYRVVFAVRLFVVVVRLKVVA